MCPVGFMGEMELPKISLDGLWGLKGETVCVCVCLYLPHVVPVGSPEASG